MITDDTTHLPLANAEVVIQALGLKTSTDASGRYVIRQVPSGVRLVQVRMVGTTRMGRCAGSRRGTR